MPNAATEMLGTRTRCKVDFSGLTEFRFQANQSTTGQANARLRVEYSLDQVTWSSLEEGGTSADLAASSATLRVSPYVSIAAEARGDVFLRILGLGGNGNTDPAWAQISLQAR